MKLHLLNPSNPIPEGQDYQTLCGAIIQKAVLVGPINQSFENASTLLFCRECIQSELPNRYVYGAISGGESRGGEAKDAEGM